MGDLSIVISSVRHCCNIGTLLPAKMDYPLHRSSMDTLCKASYQHTTDRLPKMAESAEQHASNTSMASEKYYNQHAHTLPDIQVGSNFAIYNTETKLWDIYGTVTHITPHRRYYVKTSCGRILIRNRRFFLCCRVQTSIPLST